MPQLPLFTPVPRRRQSAGMPSFRIVTSLPGLSILRQAPPRRPRRPPAQAGRETPAPEPGEPFPKTRKLLDIGSVRSTIKELLNRRLYSMNRRWERRGSGGP